jgi:hypothetical protein
VSVCNSGWNWKLLKLYFEPRMALLPGFLHGDVAKELLAAITPCTCFVFLSLIR